jgi:superfamily II DNA helicase RecQ
MHGSAIRRTNATLRLTPCRSRDKPELLLARIDAAGSDGAVIVRVLDEKAGEAATGLLRRCGREARILAPAMDSSAIARNSAWFLSADCAGLVALEGLGPPAREDVRQVLVMNLPPSLEVGADDLGRAGIDGLAASAEIFASARDIDRRLSLPLGSAERERLLRTIAWIENNGCARQFLCRELLTGECGACGNCGWCLSHAAKFIPDE